MFPHQFRKFSLELLALSIVVLPQTLLLEQFRLLFLLILHFEDVLVVVLPTHHPPEDLVLGGSGLGLGNLGEDQWLFGLSLGVVDRLDDFVGVHSL